MSRRKDGPNNCFTLVFIDALEVNFYERISPKRVKDHLVSKARRQQFNDQAGQVRLVVTDDHLELNKGLWWPNTGSHFLSHSQLRDVFPLELDGKKFVIGVANIDTRQRRILVFKARNSKECEQAVNLLDKHRKFQQTYENETMRSTLSKETESQVSVKADTSVGYYRSPSAVSFAPSPVFADFPESVPQWEQRRQRFQSIERDPYTSPYTGGTLIRNGSLNHPLDSREEYMTTHARPPRMNRTPLNPYGNPYERSASALPPDSSHYVPLGHKTSLLQRFDRNAVNPASPSRRTPMLPDYVRPNTLQRSTSFQALVKPTNGSMGYTYHNGYNQPVWDSSTEGRHRKTSKTNIGQKFAHQTNPNHNYSVDEELEQFASLNQQMLRTPSRMQSASPLLPPEYDFINHHDSNSSCYQPVLFNQASEFSSRNGNNPVQSQTYPYAFRPIGVARSESKLSPVYAVPQSPSVTIVRDMDPEINSLSNSLSSQRIENHVISLPCPSGEKLPPIPSKTLTRTRPREGAVFKHEPLEDDRHEVKPASPIRIINPPTSSGNYIQEVVFHPARKQLFSFTGDQSPMDQEVEYTSKVRDASNQDSSHRIQILNMDGSVTFSDYTNEIASTRSKDNTVGPRMHETVDGADKESRVIYVSRQRPT